jgi:hypothetical protein
VAFICLRLTFCLWPASPHWGLPALPALIPWQEGLWYDLVPRLKLSSLIRPCFDLDSLHQARDGISWGWGFWKWGREVSFPRWTLPLKSAAHPKPEKQPPLPLALLPQCEGQLQAGQLWLLEKLTMVMAVTKAKAVST